MGVPVELGHADIDPGSIQIPKGTEQKSLGHSDIDPGSIQLPGKEESSPGWLSRMGHAAVENLPSEGAAIGGLMGTPAGPAGAMGMAAAGGAAGTGLRHIIHGVQEQGLSYLNPFNKAPTLEGIKNAASDEAQGGLEGAGQEAGGQIIGKSLGAVGKALKVGEKANAPATREASERLGFKATPGMTSNSSFVQKNESLLDQSPSAAGEMVRSNTTTPVKTGIKQAAEDALSEASGDSKYQAGNKASQNIAAKVGEKYQNIQDAYEPFNKELPKMIPDPQDKFKLADQVANATKGNMSMDPGIEGYGERVANRIMSAKNLADIESVKMDVGKNIRSAAASQDYNKIDALSAIKDHLDNFRDGQFVKLSQQSAPGPLGKNMGSEMANQYLGARTQYAKLANELSDLGPDLGIRSSNPKGFIDSLNEMPPEKLSKKLFDSNNVNALNKMKEALPDAFENIRQFKLGEIKNASLDRAGDLDAAKLIRATDKYSPEARQMLFGNKMQTISDLKTVLQSFPDMVGPSGTSQAEMVKHAWRPDVQGGEAARAIVYKAAANPTINKVVTGALQAPTLPKTSGVVARKVGKVGGNFVKGLMGAQDQSNQNSGLLDGE